MNTQLKHDHFESHLSEQLITSATRVLRGFVRLFMGRMTFDVMVDLLRTIMVEEGSKRVAAENDGKVILSRVSLLTGIRTQSIKEIQHSPQQCNESDLTLESRILAQWANDTQYRDPNTGEPMELIIHGGGCTFQRLVSSVAGRGVTTQTVLERLVDSGNAQVVNDHWVKLINPHWLHVQNFESEMLDAGSFNAENQLSTLQHNLNQPEERWIERSVWSVSLPSDQIPQVRCVLNNALKGFYKTAALAIREHEDSEMPSVNDTLVGIGLYYWEREENKTSPQSEPIGIDQELRGINLRTVAAKEGVNKDDKA